jgi:hypothetical protein
MKSIRQRVLSAWTKLLHRRDRVEFYRTKMTPQQADTLNVALAKMDESFAMMDELFESMKP